MLNLLLRISTPRGGEGKHHCLDLIRFSINLDDVVRKLIFKTNLHDCVLNLSKNQVVILWLMMTPNKNSVEESSDDTGDKMNNDNGQF